MKQSVLLFVLATALLHAQWFTAVSEGPQSNDGGDSRSVNWVDFDNDNDLDLFITNGPSGGANNFLYRNNGDGTFTKVTDRSIVNDPGSYDGSTWADFDNDGTIDAFSVTWYGQKNSLHRQRNGLFEEVFPQAVAGDQTFSETASWGDYDNDGFVDLYVANSSGNLANILYRNNGEGTFSKVTAGPHVTDGIPSRSVDWCDFDNDGDLDLFVANEGGYNESLYWNLGDGTFSAESSSPIVTDGGSSFGSSVADVDNDGDFDVLVVNHANQNEALFLNNGDKTFTKVTSGAVVSSGGSSVGSAFGDLDNDGDLDLMVTNAFAGTSRVSNFLFLNNGDGTFEKIDTGAVSSDLGWSYGVAFGDYDRDGDLDIATANCYGANQNNSLYRNNGNGNAWLTVKAVGRVSNASAIGAVIKVKATIGGKSYWQVRQVAGQSGYCGQNLESHFGLGDATTVDSLIVRFPSGQTTVETNIAVRKFMIVTETVPAGFIRGSLQMEKYQDMAPADIHFSDVSTVDSTQPATSWAWDFNGDGVTDATTASATYHYSLPDTYSVRLIVGTNNTADTVTAANALIITPSTAIISFSTATHNFGIIDVNTPQKDTVMYLYNLGKLKDSLSVALVYGSTTVSTVKPDSALSIDPKQFILAPGDSQKITYTMFPRLFNRTNLNIFYTPKIVVTSKYNGGAKIFEKPMLVKLQGTLGNIREEESVPADYSLQQNYPNPFNPSTRIDFSIPQHSAARLMLYDLLGREVMSIAEGDFSPGWHSVQLHTDHLSSGFYYYRLISSGFSAVKKLLVIK